MISFGDVVRISTDAPAKDRPGELGCVVAISNPTERSGSYLAQFAKGTLYSVEFGDGETIEVHQSLVEPASL